MIKRFADRRDAALRLANALAHYRHHHPLVLAIPRGGVPIADIVAQSLGGEMDVVLVHKLCSPWNPEHPVGAIDEDGQCILNTRDPGATLAMEHEKQRCLADLRARRAMYSPGRRPLDPSGRLVIVVDEGSTSGASMSAALNAIRARRPQRLVCAVPVASATAILRIEAEVDELVCVQTPSEFHRVGEFYRNYPRVTDEQVIACLDHYHPSLAEVA